MLALDIAFTDLVLQDSEIKANESESYFISKSFKEFRKRWDMLEDMKTTHTCSCDGSGGSNRCIQAVHVIQADFWDLATQIVQALLFMC